MTVPGAQLGAVQNRATVVVKELAGLPSKKRMTKVVGAFELTLSADGAPVMVAAASLMPIPSTSTPSMSRQVILMVRTESLPR